MTPSSACAPSHSCSGRWSASIAAAKCAAIRVIAGGGAAAIGCADAVVISAHGERRARPSAARASAGGAVSALKVAGV